MHLSTIVETAADLRRRARQITPPFSTTKIIARCFPDIVVTGRDLPDGVEEIAAQTGEGHVIVYRRDLPIPKQRIVIAHGLAHILHRDEGCRPGVERDAKIEAARDAFAFELLAPLARIELELRRWRDRSASRDLYLDRVDQIASIFHVPADVIDQRIRELRRRA